MTGAPLLFLRLAGEAPSEQRMEMIQSLFLRSTWVNGFFHVVLDFNSKTYDFYMNGEQVADDFVLTKWGFSMCRLQKMRFKT